MKSHPLVVFTGLAFAFSWALWWGAAIIPGQSAFLTWLGGFGPALAAWILTAILEGADGLRRLLAKAFAWKVRPGVYLAALGIPVAGTVALMALYAWTTGDLAPLQGLPGWWTGLGKNSGALLLVFALGSVVVAGEEFGWRGYLLPKIQSGSGRPGDLAASLLVGLVWGLWHLPDLWPLRPDRQAMDLVYFMADIVTLSVLYTWLYRRSRASILVVSLFHSAYDTMVMYASATLPFLRQAHGYELAVALVFAVGIVAWHGPRRFQAGWWRREAKAEAVPLSPDSP